MITRRQQEALFRKVDALIDKHRPKAPVSETDALNDVPLLTDVAAEEQAQDELATPDADPGVSERVLAKISDETLRTLAADVFARIEQQLDDKVAQVLRQRVQQEIERAIDRGAAQTFAQLRRELLQSVGDLLGQAQTSGDVPTPAPAKPKRGKRSAS